MKLFSKLQYRHKVATVIFLFILFPFLILSILIVKKSWDDKVNGVFEKYNSEMKSSVESINTLLYSGLQKLIFINNNRTIISYLGNSDFKDMVNNMKFYDNVKLLIDTLSINNPYIDFTIYPVDKNIFNGMYVEKLERLEKRLGTEGAEEIERVLLLNWDENIWRYEVGEKNTLGYLCCYRVINSIAKNKSIAIIEMRIEIRKLIEYTESRFPNGSIVIYKLDTYSKLRFINKQNMDIKTNYWSIAYDEPVIDENRYKKIELNLSYSNGIFAVYIPKTFVASELRNFLITAGFISVFSILILFIIVEIASYLITLRLSRLIKMVNMNIDGSDINYIPEKYHIKDDIGIIENKFYEMLDKIHEYYKKTSNYENGKKTFELELLQSRINPHFLYNTLSTMRWHSNSEKMTNVIDSMVKYYRLALNKGEMIVKLSEEMELVEEYLKILAYTYESDFRYVFCIDENVKDILITKHLIQPIVENAVLHGINAVESGGIINISAKQNNSIITITVSDNGIGMTEDMVYKLLYGEYKGTIGGYGIKNVKNRINLMYGLDYSLEMSSEPDKGTTVVITIPVSRPLGS